MSLRAVLTLLCLSLAACQSGNPYTEESAPIPPAPPIEQIQSARYCGWSAKNSCVTPSRSTPDMGPQSRPSARAAIIK